MLSKFLAIILGRCTHERVTFPMRGFQRCLECAATRPYQIGQTPGRWRREPLGEA